MEALIGIALATYNGSQYVIEMLDSIEKQTFKSFHIHVTDDGSTDNTIAVIKDHKLFSEGKISIHNQQGGQGALRNFSRAISYCNEQYILLCDQDDYWLENKLEIIFDCFRENELNKGNIPLLVFSDLQIVDFNLDCIYDSFFKSSIKDSRCNKPQDFIISNHIPGCCMAINSMAKKIIEPIPDNVRMHDWWIALVISTYGELKYIDKPLVKYRQHSNNTIGVPGVGNKVFLQELMALRGAKNMIKNSNTLLTEYYSRIDVLNEKYVMLQKKEICRKKKLFSKFYYFFNSYSGERLLVTLIVWCFVNLKKQ